MASRMLAGPILRRTEAHRVSVWLALDTAAMVRLRVYPVALGPLWRGEGDTPSGRPPPVLFGEQQTFAVGEKLHIVCITAGVPAGGSVLQPGSLYCYDVEVATGPPPWPRLEYHGNLHSYQLLEPRPATKGLPLGYEVGLLPRVLLPPPDLRDLRIFHGSCRKPHAAGRDALEYLDAIIKSTMDDSLHRPHQLVLTGDQIYADDVSPLLLRHLTKKGLELMGWTEGVFVIDWDNPKGPPIERPVDSPYLQPYLRQPLIKSQNPSSAGFSSKEARCHLLGFGEFCAMYLLAWSEELIPVPLPESHDVIPETPWLDYSEEEIPDRVKLARKLREESKSLRAYTKRFLAAVPNVRRVLANIPTYMMFDDHEITDDWFLDGGWAEKALKSELGRRVITNGLAAYAVFQAWGNDPDAFAPATKGRELLTTIEAWRGQDVTKIVSIEQILGIRKKWDDPSLARTDRVTFDYSITWAHHRLVALDTRTWRGLTKNRPTELIAGPGGPFDAMIVQRLSASPVVLTFVLSPAPIFDLHLVEVFVKERIAKLPWGLRYFADAEFWSRSQPAFQRLLSALAEAGPVVILSGDVHYGFCVRCDYWNASKPAGVVIAQLVSSPLKNESGLTHGLQRIAADIERVKGWDQMSFAGWKNPGKNLWRQFFLTTERKEDDPAVDVIARGTIGNLFAASREPDWTYCLQLQTEWRDVIPSAYPGALTPVPVSPSHLPPPLTAESVLKYTREVAIRHQFQLPRAGGGRTVSGINNLGEVQIEMVQIEGSPPSIHVVQHLWWHVPNDTGNPETGEVPAPLTSHRIRMDQVSKPKPSVTVKVLP